MCGTCRRYEAPAAFASRWQERRRTENSKVSMGILLVLSTYAVLGIFLVLLCGRLLTLWKAARTIRGYAPSPPFTPHLVLKIAGDILFLSRLLKTNDLLWTGEWL